jgi:hypothetical protein
MMRCIVATIAFFLCAQSLNAQASTVDAVTKGKSCGAINEGGASSGPPDRYCEYNVSGQLQFSIYWRRDGEVTIGIAQVSAAVPGYGILYDIGLGCITITPNAATIRAMLLAERAPELAYVSPKTGGVYETEADCRRAS